MASADPPEPYRPLRIASMAAVLGVHVAALWAAIAWSQSDVQISKAEVLAVSFISQAEPLAPPEPLPPAPPPPKPVAPPKPQPLIASRATEPVADAIVVPQEPEETEAEPAPPVAAHSPAEPADKIEAEPPRFDMAYLQNPQPAFPAMSSRLREEGTVALLVRVSAKGEVLSVEISKSSGHARLDDAALRAVRHWKFKPSRRGDEAIEGMALVPIVFSLKNSS